MTPSMGRWTSLAKVWFNSIGSRFLFQDVLGSVVLVVVGLEREHSLPDTASFENLHRQVVEVDLSHGNAVLGRELGLDPLLRLRDREGGLGRERVDEERDFVAQSLHTKEPLAAQHG